MAQLVINVGTGENTGDGDTLRAALVKANTNFTELFSDSVVSSNLTFSGSTVASESNQDIILNPNGTGKVNFYNSYQFPTTDGDTNQVLMTDGSGTITFQDASVSATSTTVALTATNSTDANMFINFTDSATGNEQVRTDTGLRYNPSSGAITATSFTSDGAQGITVRDNLISTASSNADIQISPHGLGKVVIQNMSIDGEQGIITTDSSNQDLKLTPNGTGKVVITSLEVADGIITSSDSSAITINDSLDVNGTLSVNGTITTDDASNLLLNTNGGTNSGKIEIVDASNGDITIETDGNGDILLKAGGQVGIGTVSSPDTDLHIKKPNAVITLQRTADANQPGIDFQQSGGNVRAQLRMDGTSGTSNEVFVKTYDGSSTAERFRVTHTGAKVSGALEVTGNFTVLGTQTILETTTTEIEDNLIAINSKNSGGADLDAGMHINRGSAGNNAVFYWNEGEDKFKAVLSNSTSTATSVTDSSTATIVANLEGTASVATTVTVTDNESTNEENVVTFVAGADSDGGNVGLESDGNFTYNPSTGAVTATKFKGDGSELTGISSTGDVSFSGTTMSSSDSSLININEGLIVDGTFNVSGTVSSPTNSITSDSDILLHKATPLLKLRRTDNAQTPGIDFIGASGTSGAKILFDGTSGTANELIFQTFDGSLAEAFRVTQGGAKVSGILELPDGSVSDNYLGIGDAADLKLFHNGSHSIIRETGTGNLFLQSDNNVILGKDSGSETMVKGIADGAVELYHDNSKKLETTSGGVTVTGATTSGSFVTTGNAITIADNEITTGSSNADINITPHGTGKVVVKSLDVNEITSSDSSAIQIVDAVNVSGRITSATGFTGDVTGNASTATTLATARNITIAGDVDASATAFDGSGNITLNTTLDTVNSNVGSFGSTTAIPVITVNGKGLITAVSTAAISTVLAISDGSTNDNVTIGSDTLTFSATSNETTVAVSDNTVTIGLPDSITANMTAKGSNAITIADNLIKTSSSNANIEITPHGTGSVVIPKIEVGTGGDLLELTATGGDGPSIKTTSSNSDINIVPHGTGNINLTAGADVVVPANIGVTFGTAKIESDNLDLTLESIADINLNPTGDVNIPANKGLTFGDDGEKIEGDGTNLTIASSGTLTVNNTGLMSVAGALQVEGNLTVIGTTVSTSTTEVEDGLLAINTTNSGGADIDSGIHINRGSAGNNAVFYFNEGEDKFKAVLSSSGSGVTSVADTSGATVVANIETHGGQPLTLADNTITTSASNADITLDPHGTGDINLTAGADVNIPANIGLTFGDDGEKIEGDGTNLQINSSGNLTLDAEGDVIIDANDQDIIFKDAGTEFGRLTNSGNELVIKSGTSSTTALTFSGGEVTLGAKLTTAGSNRMEIFDNEIKTVASNADIEITPHGTGKVVLDKIQIDDNTIQTTDSNASLELIPNGTGEIELQTDTIQMFANTGFRTREYIMHGTTTNATETEIFVGGQSNARIPVPTDSTMTFTADITTRRTDADGTGAGYHLKGVLDNNGGTVADVGDLYEIIIAEDNADLAVDATADNTNKSLKITVTGVGSQNYSWVAVVRTYEVIE